MASQLSRSSIFKKSLIRGLQQPHHPSNAGCGSRFMSVHNLSDKEETVAFTEKHDKSILYFTASWCPPCKAIKPVYKELASEFEGKIAFGVVDVDENQEVAAENQITSVPTFVIVKGGEIDDTARIVGADVNQLKKVVQLLDGN